MADFSEQWLTKEELQEKPIQTAKPVQRGRRGEGNNQPNTSQRKQEEEKKIVAKGIDTSNWLDGALDNEEPQRPAQVARGPACNQQISFLLKGVGEELVPDKLDTSWGISQQKAQKSKHSQQSHEEAQCSNEAPRRGNRDRTQPANFKKKATYEEQSDSKPRNTYNNSNTYNGYNNGYNRDSNYRGRGRGRGQNRGGNRGYQQRDGQYESSGRNYGGGGNNYYKKRDNVEYQEKNQEQQGQKRGNRQYSNRDYRENNNRQYDNQNRRENNYNNRGNNRDHYKETNRDREQYDDRPQNSKHYSQKNQQDTVSTVSKTDTKVIIIQKEKQKPQSIIPKGRRCWPQSSIYILGCKFSICYRPITEYRCKLLVIPYASLKLEYYPGNIINSSEVDYKARILAKGEQISSPGSVYLQKAISVGTFAGIAFLKVDEKRVSDSLKLGIKNLLNTVQRLQGSTVLESILFPICEQLSNIQSVISTFLQNLQSYKRIKEIYIATNQSQCFMKAMNIFVDQVQEMLDDNQILMT